MRYILSMVLLLFVTSSSAQLTLTVTVCDPNNVCATSQVPASNDPAFGLIPTANDVFPNWWRSGLAVIGGIPTRSTQCGSTITPSGLTPPVANDDAALINAAITACTAGQVVLLSGATFHLDQSETIIVNKGVTLRGSGTCNNGSTPYCPTVINVDNGLLPWTGGQCGLNTSSEVACNNGPGAIVMWAPNAGNRFDFNWGGSLGHCNLIGSGIACGTQLDADAAKGDTTIQVHTTTGLSVGQWIKIDEATGANYQTDPVGPNLYGNVWAAPDTFNTSPDPATGRVQWAKYVTCGGNPFCDTTGFPYNAPGTIETLYDRPTTEIHVISAIGAGPCPGTSCTVTFDDPLMIAYRVSGMTTFTGSIASTTLTTSGDNCTVAAGQIVDDATHTISDGTYITAINSCSGGAGNYTVNHSQTVASETMIGGAHQAHVYWSTNASGTTMAFLQQASVENLTVNRAQAGGINITMCAYCWMKNVEVVNWGGGIGASGGAFNFNDSARVQLDTSYANNAGNSVNNGAEYPLGMQGASTELLIVNNIIVQGGKGMVGKSGGGNVVAYNYQDMTFYDAFSGIGDWFIDMGTNGSHWVGTHHYLFEGNWADNLDHDDTHGNAVYHVHFRNWSTALRSDFVDPSIPNQATQCGGTCLISDKTPKGGSFANGGSGWFCATSTTCVANGTGPLRAAGPMLHLYWFAYVGNVLGTPSVTTAGNGFQYHTNGAVGIGIWLSGWNSDASHETVTDPNLNGTNNPQFLFKNGNYDYVTASISDWAAGYSQTLTNSFYLFSAPSFFSPGASCTYVWPWVTPTSSPKVQSNSCAGSGLPAKARFDAGTPFVQP